MNALSHGFSSLLLLERDFLERHTNELVADKLCNELEPVHKERILALASLQAAIASNKGTKIKVLLRNLRTLERRERAIVKSIALASPPNV